MALFAATGTAPAQKPASQTMLRTVPAAEAPQLVGTGERFQVVAVVTEEVAPGFIFLQDASGALRVNLRKRFPVKPGDVLRMTIDAFSDNGSWFISSQAERIGEKPLPVPEHVDADKATIARHNSAYLTVRGRVASHTETRQRYYVDGEWLTLTFEVALVDCNGLTVRVLFPPGSNVTEHFPVGIVAEFTGVCRLAITQGVTESRDMEIITAGPKVVRIVEGAELLPRKPLEPWMVWSLYGAGALVLFSGTWMLWRWRRARLAAEQLQQMNAELETRVAERTAELHVALARERELGEMKSNFVSLVSHEFRTPLGVIMSAAEVLQRYFERLPEGKRAQHLDMIIRSTRNLANLIEEVLLLGRVQEGRTHFSPVPVELEKFCRTLCDELHSALGAGCVIQLQIVNSLDGAVSDETLLRHVLSNLLSNAVKYSDASSSVDFTVERRAGDAVFTVRDHGIGIAPEDRARLFTSFTRGRNVGTRPGTGLGLVIVQRCLELHGGKLHLDSELGRGTTVTVTLPVFLQPTPSSISKTTKS
jgi:signal transduction histidine kinase